MSQERHPSEAWPRCANPDCQVLVQNKTYLQDGLCAKCVYAKRYPGPAKDEPLVVERPMPKKKSYSAPLTASPGDGIGGLW